jgi:argininosuccinate lyase
LLTGLLATLKGLPSTYDKDLQEDKEPVFQATDTLLAILPVIAGALRTITAKPERMRNAIDLVEHSDRGYLISDMNRTMEFHTMQPLSGIDIAGEIVEYAMSLAKVRA